MDSLPGRIDFERPPWLLDAAITTKEAASLLDVNHETLRHWIKVANLMGIPISAKPRGKPRLTSHGVYIAAILAALHKAGIDCGPYLMRAAWSVAHDEGRPRLPCLFEKIALNEQDGAGRPVAQIVVDISNVWMEIQPRLDALMAADFTGANNDS